MADNVQLNSGTGGDVAAADDVGGVKYQRIKLTLGADGAADGDIHATNPMPAKERRPGTSSVASVSASTSSASILASNSNRIGACFFNDSSYALFLKFGATASATSFTAKLEGGGFFTLPHPAYTGAIDGIWDGATGAVRVTELT
jgi:hypothetical protein